jgi:hypothetical protein
MVCTGPLPSKMPAADAGSTRTVVDDEMNRLLPVSQATPPTMFGGWHTMWLCPRCRGPKRLRRTTASIANIGAGRERPHKRRAISAAVPKPPRCIRAQRNGSRLSAIHRRRIQQIRALRHLRVRRGAYSVGPMGQPLATLGPGMALRGISHRQPPYRLLAWALQ